MQNYKKSMQRKSPTPVSQPSSPPSHGKTILCSFKALECTFRQIHIFFPLPPFIKECSVFCVLFATAEHIFTQRSFFYQYTEHFFIFYNCTALHYISNYLTTDGNLVVSNLFILQCYK